jgi:hypothetical protein
VSWLPSVPSLSATSWWRLLLPWVLALQLNHLNTTWQSVLVAGMAQGPIIGFSQLSAAEVLPFPPAVPRGTAPTSTGSSTGPEGDNKASCASPCWGATVPSFKVASQTLQLKTSTAHFLYSGWPELKSSGLKIWGARQSFCQAMLCHCFLLILVLLFASQHSTSPPCKLVLNTSLNTWRPMVVSVAFGDHKMIKLRQLCHTIPT